MRWSWRIARLAGIGIYLHVTFILILAWVGFEQFTLRQSWVDVGAGLGFVVILFGIVVLHELGHAITARRFGIETKDITLLPIGGVARLERMPDDPKQELLVALAGPAVNICLAALILAILGGTRQFSELTHLNIGGGGFLWLLLQVNLILAAFNLVPAFPMDGGRVLRALLAMRISYVRATNIAAGIGRIIAFGFGFIGLSSIFFGGIGGYSNPFLLFIGLFVWLGGSQEAMLVRMRSAFGDVRVGELMITDFRCLAPGEPVSRAVEHMLIGWQRDFPVAEEGRLVGFLNRGTLFASLARNGERALVGEVMDRRVVTVGKEDRAEAAFVRLRSAESQILPVVDEGFLVGILTGENVRSYLMIRAALAERPDGSKCTLSIPVRQTT